MNLREQFEDGLSKLQVELFKQREQLYWQAYSEWLEHRNKEQVEVLQSCKEYIRECGIDEEWEIELLEEIEEQLKKSE